MFRKELLYIQLRKVPSEKSPLDMKEVKFFRIELLYIIQEITMSPTFCWSPAEKLTLFNMIA